MRRLYGTALSSCVLVGTFLAAACAADSGSTPPGGSAGGGGGAAATPGSDGGFSVAGSGNGSSIGVDGGGGSGGGMSCGTQSADAMLTSEPIDILVVLDNSGSMHEEMGAVEANINQNFATVLTTSGVDYRVILLSRHRVGARTTGETAANTSVCVTQPLSGLATCPAPLPVFTDRFYQYGEKIESFDALNWLLDGYHTPPEDDDFAALAPTGYSPWLRQNAKKVILVLTDDDEGNTGDDNPLTVDQFIQSLTALVPAHFGTVEAPAFTFHSIIGVKEKATPTEAYLPTEPIVTEKCTGNGASIPDVGESYQELSIRTGGLRFPLCQYPGYDAVFRRIAEDVIVKSTISCEFSIPPPPEGRELDLSQVAVEHTKGDGSGTVTFGQAASAAECQPNAFYIDTTDNLVHLCPDTCAQVQADTGAAVDVLFTCESQILPPPE